MNLTKKMWAVMQIDGAGSVQATLWGTIGEALDHASRVYSLTRVMPIIFECHTVQQ